MKNIIEAIVDFFRKYILCCIIPYDTPMREVESLLVPDATEQPLIPNGDSRTNSTSKLLVKQMPTHNEDGNEAEIDQNKDNDRKRKHTISRVHRMPPGSDISLMITGGYLGRHNRKIAAMVAKFNNDDDEDNSQYSSASLR